jgi:hypothetical protein
MAKKLKFTYGRAFKLFIVIIIMLIALIILFEVRLKFNVVELEAVKTKLLFLMSLVLILCVLFAAGINRIASGIIRSRQFPPPGVDLLFKLPTLKGKSAIFRARVLQLLAASIVGVGLYTVIFVSQLITQYS